MNEQRKRVTQYPRETCYFCGTEGPIETHHILPQRHGGGDQQENLLDVCSNCHRKIEQAYTDNVWTQTLDENSEETVRQDTIDQDEVCTSPFAESVGKLSPHGKHVLHALAVVEENGDGPIKSRELYPIYESVCASKETDPLTLRSVRNHLSEQRDMSFVHTRRKNRGAGGGSYMLYELDIDHEKLLSFFRSGSDELVNDTKSTSQQKLD